MLVVTLLIGQDLETQSRDSVRICFAPRRWRRANNAAAEAVRAAFTSFLTGPSLSSQLPFASAVAAAKAG